MQLERTKEVFTTAQSLGRAEPPVRFAQMFDPKQLPPDFRKQLLHRAPKLCNCSKLWTFRVPEEAEIDLESRESQDGGLEELIYEPQTPPNTPSAAASAADSPVARSKSKKRSEGKMEPGSPGSPGPTSSPSWLLRQMRIPSLTSEISELSGEGVELRRSSTLTQQEGQAKVCPQ